MPESRSPAADVLDLDQCKSLRNASTLLRVEDKPGRHIGGRAGGEIEAMTDRLISDMVRNQRPLTLHTDATVAEACGQMDERRVGAVLVTDADDHLIDIFTGRDAVRVLAQRRPAESPLATVMTCSPDTLPPGT